MFIAVALHPPPPQLSAVDHQTSIFEVISCLLPNESGISSSFSFFYITTIQPSQTSPLHSILLFPCSEQWPGNGAKRIGYSPTLLCGKEMETADSLGKIELWHYRVIVGPRSVIFQMVFDSRIRSERPELAMRWSYLTEVLSTSPSTTTYHSL